MALLSKARATLGFLINRAQSQETSMPPARIHDIFRMSPLALSNTQGRENVFNGISFHLFEDHDLQASSESLSSKKGFIFASTRKLLTISPDLGSMSSFLRIGGPSK